MNLIGWAQEGCMSVGSPWDCRCKEWLRKGFDSFTYCILYLKFQGCRSVHKNQFTCIHNMHTTVVTLVFAMQSGTKKACAATCQVGSSTIDAIKHFWVPACTAQDSTTRLIHCFTHIGPSAKLHLYCRYVKHWKQCQYRQERHISSFKSWRVGQHT